MASAELLHLPVPLPGKFDVPSWALDGLDHQRGDLVHARLRDRRLERIDARQLAARIGQTEWAPVAVGGGSLAEAGQRWAPGIQSRSSGSPSSPLVASPRPW